MKKIIYIILGIFTLSINFENIYLVYAQLDDNFGYEPEIQNEDENDLNEESDGDNNLEEINNDEINPEKLGKDMNNIDNQDFTFQSDDLQETVTVTDVEITENVADIQPVLALKNDNIQVYEVTQVRQHIDTSGYGIIRIADPENPRKGITIHDRNLGATTTGYGASDDKNSYGYYFQWGNNYGFPTTGDIEKILDYSEANIDASAYGPDNPYSSDTFIKGNSYWSSTHNDNLWGGSGDNRNNGRGYPIKNATQRQGPCPEGYHVPSIGEWSTLLDFWAFEYTGAGNNVDLQKDTYYNLGVFVMNSTSVGTDFMERFNLPVSGKRSYNTSNIDNVYMTIWSSSILSNDSAFPINGSSYEMYTNNPFIQRAHGVPVRCFYNSYWLPIIITYDINGGYWSGSENSNQIITTYTSNDGLIYTGDKELTIPKKDDSCGESGNEKCMFAGWYLGTDENAKIWTGDMSKDIIVYAKWLPFEDKDIMLSGVNFTIMDRNLGSIGSGTGENAYGYYLSGGEEDVICPEGYHIPSTGEWLGIIKFLDSDFYSKYIESLLNLPFAGELRNNEIIGTGESGYYLAKDGENFMYAKISNSGIEIKSLEEGEKVSTRCFKDYYTGTIIFNANGGNNIENITAVNWREEGEILQIPSRENSNFSGWYTTDNFEEGSMIEKNINYKNEEQINLYAKWNCQEGYLKNGNKCDAIYFNVTWIDGNGEILKTDSVKRGNTPTYDGDIPTKNSTSDYKYIFNNKWLPEISVVTGDVEYTAQFDEEIIKKSDGGSSGGGGKRSSTINSHGSANSNIQDEIKPIKEYGTGEIIMDKAIDDGTNNISSGVNIDEISLDNISELQKNYSKEFIDAYNFAKRYGITTVNSIEDAKMYSPITRIEMAKMLSNFSINVLGKEPDLSKGVLKFYDVTNQLNSKYDNAVTKAYQLGIMGQNIKNRLFRPNDYVSRGEFVTALSRLLYDTKDGKGKIKYYEPHILKLYNEGIITNTNPGIQEKRGYTMIMLTKSITSH